MSCWRSTVSAAALLSLVASVRGQVNGNDILRYVDQLIGTDNGGNVFAGATLRKYPVLSPLLE